MRLISEGFGRDPLAAGASRSVSPSRVTLHSLATSLQMYAGGPEASRATSSWPRPQNEQRIGCGVAMRFFMRVRSSSTGRRRHGPRGPGRSASLLDDLVHETVTLGFLGGEPVVAVGILHDLVDGSAGVLGQDAVELLARLEHLARRDLDVGGLPGGAAEGLVDHDLRVREAVALARRAGGEQHRAHAGRGAQGGGADGPLPELPRVLDREARRDDAARTLDVQVDVAVRILALEKDHLGDDQVRDVVVDRRPDEDDAILEQARVDVVGPFTTARLLYHERNGRDRKSVV